jgi:hypothetical protein
MREISELLAIAVDQRGKAIVEPAIIEELYERLWSEFDSSDVGIELHRRGVTNEAVFEIYRSRYPDVGPRSVPVFESLEDIARDLLKLAPEPVVRPKPKANLESARPKAVEPPKASKEVTAFAHAYNRQVVTHGMESLRPKGGVLTVYFDGKPYDYPASEGKNLLDQALSFGLIR